VPCPEPYATGEQVELAGVDATFADRQLAEFVDQQQSDSGPLDAMEMRAASLERARRRARGPELAVVADTRVESMPARLYRPALDELPLVLFVHGGGFTIGALATHDRVCRRLADSGHVAVLAVEYRLAPEHPWPAAIDDVVRALSWIAGSPPELGPTCGLAVAGDSAGGTLATLACQRVRDDHPAALPDLQVLICPNTDLTGSQPSMREKAVGFGLTAAAVRFFNSQWVPDPSMWGDPRVSPLYSPDLSNLPAAVIVTAEHDPLRDEGEAYARALAKAGVAVQCRREQGLIHGFVMMDEISPACAAAADRLAADVGAGLRELAS
jgi:acetyl esterase/lipase